MTMIESIRDFVQMCPALHEAASVSVDELEDDVDAFCVSALPGKTVIEEYTDGTKLLEFPFSVSSVNCTADEAARLETSDVYEQLAGWLDDCTERDELPELPDGMTAESIEAVTWAYLFQREKAADTAIYQITCKLTYTSWKG